jgi:hypothetical protein
MKPGDLVRIKWTTVEQHARAQRFGLAGGKTPNSVGIIIEAHVPGARGTHLEKGAAKVMFPETGIKTYLISSLEIVGKANETS